MPAAAPLAIFKLKVLNPGGQTFRKLPHVCRDIDAVAAVMAGRPAAFDWIFELTAARAARAEPNAGRYLFHVRHEFKV